MAGLTQPSTLGDSLESSLIKMSTKEPLQKCPSSVCDNQSTGSGTYYLISQSGEGTKNPSRGSQPRQQYLYLINLCYFQQITLETFNLFKKVGYQGGAQILPEEKGVLQREQDLLFKNASSLGVLPIPYPKISSALHSSMD